MTLNTNIDVDLELCTNTIELENYFMEKGITRVLEQYNFLKDYMCVVDTVDYGEISDKIKCEILKEMFVAGEWRQMTNKYVITVE